MQCVRLLLDRRLEGSPHDFEIVIAVYRNLLRMCMQRHLNVAIDMNAHSSNIKEVESFVKREQDGQGYQVVKICLNPSVEALFARVRARPQIEGLHQGTEKDVQNDISATIKKIDFNDYALVVNSEIVPFETEFNFFDVARMSIHIDSYIEMTLHAHSQQIAIDGDHDCQVMTTA